MAIDIKNITESSVTLYYVGTSIDDVNKKDIDWYLDGRYVGSSVISPGNIGSNGCWVSGLSINTYYSVRANITWYGGGGGTKVETSSFKTLAPRPSNFYWSNSAKNVFNNRGFTNGIDYTEWNNFVQRTKEFFMWYWNYSSDVENIESAKMSSGDKTIYAAKFNKVRSCIGGMVSTGLPDFKKGDSVLGSYFTTLEAKMNAISYPRSTLEDYYIKPSDEESYAVYNKCFDEIDNSEKYWEDALNGTRR